MIQLQLAFDRINSKFVLVSVPSAFPIGCRDFVAESQEEISLLIWRSGSVLGIAHKVAVIVRQHFLEEKRGLSFEVVEVGGVSLKMPVCLAVTTVEVKADVLATVVGFICRYLPDPRLHLELADHLGLGA